MTTHHHTIRTTWSGSTGAGYDGYDRGHEATSVAAVRLALSSDPAFRGDPARWNPEQLLVLAASSCQLLAFLAVAARARQDVVGYEDEAIGEMPEDDRPARITRIVLRPRITMGSAVSPERVRHLVEVAHRECYIASSLRTEIQIEPEIIIPE